VACKAGLRESARAWQMDYSPTENGEQEVRAGQNEICPGEFQPRFAPAFAVGRCMAELRLDGGNLSACGGINQFRLGC
jgi:hypothetical protein